MASESEQVVLFDLPSKQGTAWSLNPWKTRFLLNYKNIPYRTEWIEYPDLQARFEPHIPGGNGGEYTIPTLRLPDGTWHMDSRRIADVLDAKYPDTPPLKLDSPALAKVMELMPALMAALRGNYLPVVPKRLLNDASLAYWYRTREAKVGMPLDEFEATEGGDVGFAKAEAPLKEVSALLKENAQGPFFEGGVVTYVDFVWAGFLVFWQRIGDDKFHELLKRSGAPEVHSALLKAVEPWSKRDNH